MRNVEVYKNGSIFLNFKPMRVFVGEDKFFNRKIDLIWEDMGVIDYRKLDLYGTYSCAYCKSKFENGTLTISGENGIEIRIS